MDWYLKPFNALTVPELHSIYKARCEVFIVEQHCPYQDIDDFEPASLHLFAMEEDVLAAYCRLVPKGVRFPEASIGRVITTPTFRRGGWGRQLMTRAIAHITNEWHETQIRISAQAYLQTFYESFGFVVVSDLYREDDIPHFDMLYNVTQPATRQEH